MVRPITITFRDYKLVIYEAITKHLLVPSHSLQNFITLCFGNIKYETFLHQLSHIFRAIISGIFQIETYVGDVLTDLKTFILFVPIFICWDYKAARNIQITELLLIRL